MDGERGTVYSTIPTTFMNCVRRERSRRVAPLSARIRTGGEPGRNRGGKRAQWGSKVYWQS